MVARDARVRAREGLVVSAKGEAHYITDLATGQVWEMNATAALLFEAARKGATVKALSDALAAKHPEVPRDEVERDAAELVEEMVRAGLLVP